MLFENSNGIMFQTLQTVINPMCGIFGLYNLVLRRWKWLGKLYVDNNNIWVLPASFHSFFIVSSNNIKCCLGSRSEQIGLTAAHTKKLSKHTAVKNV